MFWKYNSLTVSHLDTLLDKQGVTLQEILEQEDIIQECKSQNKKLVDYLTKQEILSELLDLILQEPSPELEEKLRFKLPNIASEVITCDVPQINEKLSSDTTLLDKMYAFLEGSPPLNPLLTSFFSKAFGVLITRRPEQNWYSYQYTCLQVIEYIKVKEGFTGLLLTHIATSAVMDLLLRLITCVEGTENKQNILTWLNDERLIQRVLALLAPPEVPPGDGGGGEGGEGEAAAAVVQHPQPEPVVGEQHDNAGQLLVEIIRVSRDAQITATPTERFHNPLLATAESPDMVHLLLGYMLDGPAVESTIVNGVEVLLSLLEIRRPAPQGGGFYPYTTEQDQTPNQADIDRQQAVLQTTVECLIPRLPQITALLINPPYKPPVHTTCGVLNVPLGRTRLSLAKLVSALLSTNHPPLNSALAQANTATVLLDLFFEYSLNNFLHAQVESCVHSIIFWKEKTDLDVTQENVALPDPNSSSLQTPKITEPDPADSEAPKHPLEEKIMDNPALVHLLTNARLLDRLITTWTNTNLPPIVSYMGHVTRISNDLMMACGSDTVPLCQSRTLLLQLLSKLPEETQTSWGTVTTGRLADTNKMNEVKPSTDDKRTLSSDDEDSDFRDIQFPQDSALQQMQEMSDNFIDSFGFHDDEFTESDENVSRGMRKLNSVNFLMQTDDSTKQAIFDSVCEQRIKAFRSSPTPGQEAEEDPWADKTAEISFGGPGARTSGEGAVRGEGDGEAVDSSDEESEPAPDKMEVDNDQDPWDTISAPTSTGPVAMDTSSPWGQPAQPAPVGETGWADFGAFSSGGGEGMEGFMPQGEESMEGEMDGKVGGEGWSPAMASSPEATMLDCATVEQSPQRAASPALLSRLAPPDISDSNANPAPVPSDKLPADTAAVADRLAAADQPLPAADSTVGEAGQTGQAQPETLTDNFSFLAARGLISSSESSGCDSSATATEISSTSSEVGDKVVGCDSSSGDKESSVVEPNTQTDKPVEQVADSSSDAPT
eukprot:TRINITY_DN1059_c0_g1_i2.p1 TRINITY_DN1059_c0_g1~~TRINITY_DN1059_c0_g1_i2.p1  ORF type:complete len:1001 (-),score=360.21 TRINITY_DN1059_c0_g1_i2:284-3286(-)